MPAGEKANVSGDTVERVVAGVFGGRGYTVLPRAVLGTNIYGGALICDLLLPDVPLCCEVKWQSSRGSVDEKFPYLVTNIQSNCYPHPVVIVVDGEGVRTGAVNWLKNQVDQRKLIGVFNVSELVQWVMREM